MKIHLPKTLSPDFRERACGNRMPTPHSDPVHLMKPGYQKGQPPIRRSLLI